MNAATRPRRRETQIKCAFAVMAVGIVALTLWRILDPSEAATKPYFNTMYGVSDRRAPREFIGSVMLRSGGDFDAPLVLADDGVLDRIESSATFDGTQFVIDERLKDAILNAPELRWLMLCRQTTPEDLQWIAELKQLRGLGIWNADLSRADLQVLNRLSSLEWLNLTNSRMPPASRGLPALPKLEALYVDCCLTDGLIPDVGQFPDLKLFSASLTPMTDQELLKLSRSCPKLRSLNLYHCENLTSKSVQVVCEFEDLEYVHIGYTGMMYIGASDEIRAQLPNCEVSNGD